MNPVLKPVEEGFKPDNMHMSKVYTPLGYQQGLELLCKAIDAGVPIQREIGHSQVALTFQGVYLCLWEAALIEAWW